MSDKQISWIEEICDFDIPNNHRAERIYMQQYIDGSYENVIKLMREILNIKSTSYVTIDAAHIKKGTYHRRPGLHVDGSWEEGWRYTKKNFTGIDQDMYLYSTKLGCRALIGEYEHQETTDGSFHFLDTSNMVYKNLEPRKIYKASALYTLHESFPAKEDHFRVFIRILAEKERGN